MSTLEEVEHSAALRLEAWSQRRTAEAMTNLAQRFANLGTDAKFRMSASGEGTRAHAEHSAELAVYREAWRMCKAEADHLEREAGVIEGRSEPWAAT